MTDRDSFAAAALTGLLAQGDDGSFSEESYVRAAYRWADTMLRERNGALVGCETVPDADSRVWESRPNDAWATAYAVTRACEIANHAPVTEPMPKEKRAEVYDGPQPTLTDAEREAMRFCVTASLPETEKLGGVAGGLCRMHAATLRGLLERIK